MQCDHNVSLAGDEMAGFSLRIAMLKRGLNFDDIAKLCGIGRHQFLCELRLGFPSRVLRFRIERIFDLPLYFWSPLVELRMRRRFIREHGTDPRELKRPELKAICRRLGVEIAKSRRMEDQFQLLVKYYSRNPEQKKVEQYD